MMTLTEKAAYIKGLVEGLELDGTTKEAKIIKALVDIVDDITLSLADAEDDIAVLADEIDEIEEHLNAVDVDLAEVEEILYEECEDDDFDCDCDCDFDCDGCDGCDDEFDDAFEYEVECPECGEVFCFDESVFEDDEPLTCPNCGMVIDEIEIEDEDEE